MQNYFNKGGEMLLHFVDIETSHLDPNQGEITEIAIITYDLKTKDVLTFVEKIKLEKPENADPKSLEIGNYDEKIWNRDAVKFSSVAEHISKKLSKGYFVAHNVSFDYSFVKKQLKECGFNRITYKKFDTKDLVFEHLYPTLSSTSMMSVRDFFGWSMEKSHTALKDAEDCFKIYLMLNKCGWLKRNYYTVRYRLRNFLINSKYSWVQLLALYI